MRKWRVSECTASVNLKGRFLSFFFFFFLFFVFPSATFENLYPWLYFQRLPCQPGTCVQPCKTYWSQYTAVRHVLKDFEKLGS